MREHTMDSITRLYHALNEAKMNLLNEESLHTQLWNRANGSKSNNPRIDRMSVAKALQLNGAQDKAMDREGGEEGRAKRAISTRQLKNVRESTAMDRNGISKDRQTKIRDTIKDRPTDARNTSLADKLHDREDPSGINPYLPRVGRKSPHIEKLSRGKAAKLADSMYKAREKQYFDRKEKRNK